MRKALIVVAVALVAAGLLVYRLLGSLDSIVKAAIEKQGTQLTGTDVRVESVELALGEGRGRIVGLTVANPPGFSTAPAFRLGEIEVRIDTGTVIRNPVVIEEIRIASPRVSFEVDAQGRANVEVIRWNLDHKDAPAREQRKSTGKAGTEPDGGSGLLLIVDRIWVEGGLVDVDATALGGKVETTSLPDFELTDVGRRENGVTPSKLGKTFAVALARDVAVAVAATQIERYVGKNLGGPLGDLLREGGSGAIGKGLGGFLDKVIGR